MKILIVGATGMLGYSLFSVMSANNKYEVFGSVRSLDGLEHFFVNHQSHIIDDIDIKNPNRLFDVLNKIKPDVVINCIGLIKQHDSSKNHINAIFTNSLFPHELAKICSSHGAKLITFSTDCVFSGTKGGYLESELPDAEDLYGKSKLLGEVDYKPHLTLRTSIIGHELRSSVSLVDWFLSQKRSTRGFSRAVFSGLPTCVIARILMESILPNEGLSGLYHLSVEPIDKFTLLNIIAETYNKNIEIRESKDLHIDRSLNSDKLRHELSLTVPSWQDLIFEMHTDFVDKYQNRRS